MVNSFINPHPSGVGAVAMPGSSASKSRIPSALRCIGAFNAAVLLLSLLPMLVVAQEEASEKSWLSDGFNFKAETGDRHFVIASPFTIHFSENEEDGGHKYVWLLGYERERENGWLTGLAYFSNSFGQPCVYYYPWGKTYTDFAGVKGMFVKWNAGIVYGYVEPYEDKVPFNYGGFTPALFPSIGYRAKNNFQTQINMLGNAGLMLQFSVPVDSIKGR
jgi:hypothetical protein